MEVRPGYRQTSAGTIPEEWDVTSLGRFVALQRGHDLTERDRRQGDVPVMGSAGPSGFHDTALARGPGVVVGRSGASFGQVHYCQTGFWPHNTALYVTDFFGNHPRFAFYLLKSIDFSRHNSGGAQQSLNRNFIAPIPVAVPKREEQEAIAEALSDADALIESLEQHLAKQRNLKLGAMQELLTSKRRLPGFSGDWRVRCLGDVAEIQKGELITGKNAVPGVIPVIAGGKQPAYSHVRANRLGKTITISGSGANAGYVAFHRTPLFASDCSTIGEGTNYSVDFIYFALLLKQDAIYTTQTGGAQPHVHPSDLRRLLISVPETRNEQAAIAAILADMEAEITVLDATLTKTRQLKLGMMQDLLTGRIRLVRTVSSVGPLSVSADPAPAWAKSHNWQINEAVVISVLTKHFGSEQFPLGRKRYTKLSYLLHRHEEGRVEGYRKKAAGPYNPATKYKGPEAIALRNCYVRLHSQGSFSGFVAAERSGEAESYFSRWYGDDVLHWLEQFRRKSNDELELLATVDMAMEDLQGSGTSVELATVKQVIQDHPEWKAKLDRALFSDENIHLAIKSCRQLFGSENGEG